MVSIKHLDMTVIGDEELVNALRLAGISKYYTIHHDQDSRGNVRKTLTEALANPDVGIVVILEDYAEYVADMLGQLRNKKGARGLIRESIGFEVEI